jgi:hypothetical protein
MFAQSSRKNPGHRGITPEETNNALLPAYAGWIEFCGAHSQLASVWERINKFETAHTVTLAVTVPASVFAVVPSFFSSPPPL